MAAEDYRDSHKSKGGQYDAWISSSALDAYMDKWEGYHLDRVLAHLFPAQIPRYLDFACGTGRITQRIEPRASESFGVDVSETMLDAARRKCHSTKFVCADLTRDDTQLGLFDLVTSFRFFGNAQDELRAAALTAINRHLRPGGYLIINNHRNPCNLSVIGRTFPPDHPRMDLTHHKLGELLRRHGFEITYKRPIGAWIFRQKLLTAKVLESSWADKLERMFQLSWFVPMSGDALIVARKTARPID